MRNYSEVLCEEQNVQIADYQIFVSHTYLGMSIRDLITSSPLSFFVLAVFLRLLPFWTTAPSAPNLHILILFTDPPSKILNFSPCFGIWHQISRLFYLSLPVARTQIHQLYENLNCSQWFQYFSHMQLFQLLHARLLTLDHFDLPQPLRLQLHLPTSTTSTWSTWVFQVS